MTARTRPQAPPPRKRNPPPPSRNASVRESPALDHLPVKFLNARLRFHRSVARQTRTHPIKPPLTHPLPRRRRGQQSSRNHRIIHHYALLEQQTHIPYITFFTLHAVVSHLNLIVSTCPYPRVQNVPAPLRRARSPMTTSTSTVDASYASQLLARGVEQLADVRIYSM
jgi:hypothetical protein